MAGRSFLAQPQLQFFQQISQSADTFCDGFRIGIRVVKTHGIGISDVCIEGVSRDKRDFFLQSFREQRHSAHSFRKRYPQKHTAVWLGIFHCRRKIPIYGVRHCVRLFFVQLRYLCDMHVQIVVFQIVSDQILRKDICVQIARFFGNGYVL